MQIAERDVNLRLILNVLYIHHFIVGLFDPYLISLVIMNIEFWVDYEYGECRQSTSAP
jgi:hypothetical protein